MPDHTEAEWARLALELERAREIIADLHTDLKALASVAADNAQLLRELSAIRGDRDE